MHYKIIKNWGKMLNFNYKQSLFGDLYRRGTGRLDSTASQLRQAKRACVRYITEDILITTKWLII